MGCQTDPVISSPTGVAKIEVPIGFPEIPFPEDNGYTIERWELGKQLFFDKRLSIDSSISCGTCHKPELAFSDQLPTTPGVKNRPGIRNAPTLANVAYHPYYTREGGVPSLEMQVLVPIQEHNEFDFNIVDIGKRLSYDTEYQDLSQRAYNRTLDYYVIVRAIATFERSIISGNSPYDQFFYQGKNTLSTNEKKGMELFFSDRTQCSKCHDGFNFSNYAFENNGLYENYTDPGRSRLTSNPSDVALFKVPTLRNISLTAPYMHDGSMATIDEVIEHYNSGGKNHPNKSGLITPLNLTTQEKVELKAFLHSLSDIHFIENKKFKE